MHNKNGISSVTEVGHHINYHPPSHRIVFVLVSFFKVWLRQLCSIIAYGQAHLCQSNGSRLTTQQPFANRALILFSPQRKNHWSERIVKISFVFAS